MRKALFLTTGLAWLALTGAAGAAPVITLTPGPQDPQYFDPEAAGQNNFTLGGITWSLVSGTASTEKGTLPSLCMPLLWGWAPPRPRARRISLLKAAVRNWRPGRRLRPASAIYWGSIDGLTGGNVNLNSIAITVDGFTLTGADLVALGASGNGDQSSPSGNQLVRITGLGDFTQVSFSSTGNAFEFSLGSAVPEPSTWVMMALGFAGLGYAAFRRNSKKGQMAFGVI